MKRLGAVALGVALAGPALADEGESTTVADALQVGTNKNYKPLIHKRIAGITVSAPIWLKTSGRYFDPVQVDPGTEFAPDAVVDPQVRAGLVLDSELFYAPLVFKAELEADFVSGVASGGYDPTPAQADDYVGAPHTNELDTLVLRKAYGRFSFGPMITLGGGYMTSHWGLGLLANDGAHDWTPGSAYFGDPRGGDRVLRGFVASGPWTGADLMFSLAVDQVQGDDIMTADDDEATQIIGAVTAGYQKDRQIGAYVVHRTQTAGDGAETVINAFDVYGKWSGRMGQGLTYSTELEAAFILGTTELAPSLDFVEHDVMQLGVASRTRIDGGDYGGVLDFVWATGDQDFDDNAQNAFKADPNFEMGLIAFRHVIAAQTARGPARAGDLDLVGRANPDLDRFPTRGSVSNTIALFPKGFYRPVAGLEIYGGPLFAFAEVPPADPRNSRLGGGQARNALDGAPGTYLGTEFDVGVRYRMLLAGTELTLGLEGGLFMPGDALVDRDGGVPDALSGGRAMIRYRL
ncbi:MAG: hypothetical protein KC613_17660 [Myxococcales bacterium]|nr:hypothetical protein [Myxococcales bacterium]MCB9524696.1 hypothetical protein [Myxococcales bacterium]